VFGNKTKFVSRDERFTNVRDANIHVVHPTRRYVTVDNRGYVFERKKQNISDQNRRREDNRKILFRFDALPYGNIFAYLQFATF